MLGKKIKLPNLKAIVNEKITEIDFSAYEGLNILFIFYPYDFSFVCPTEINEISNLYEEFKDRNTEVFFVSCDSLYSHIGWTKVERKNKGIKGVYWPVISDYTKEFCKSLNLLESDGSAMRATVLIDDSRIIKHISMYDPKIGRSCPELLRIIDAMIYTNKYGEVCRINWTRQ